MIVMDIFGDCSFFDIVKSGFNRPFVYPAANPNRWFGGRETGLGACIFPAFAEARHGRR
jgi:hypothetical protein